MGRNLLFVNKYGGGRSGSGRFVKEKGISGACDRAYDGGM